MAAQLPAKLKAADISRFAQRAAQLETAKPAIAYWCEYWIVNQLLARGLHNTDEECLQYTTTLMDKLEKTKTKYAHDDAIIDDTAGQAYVEQFGLETFERADRAVQADKVTKQTADTFLAASTFLELLNIWGEPDKDIQAKIRYAKWNAVRIVKAIKDGNDPNDSNPKPEPELEGELQPLDPNDPEVQDLGGLPSNSQQASVEEVPDEQDQIQPYLAARSILDRSLHPSAQASAQHSSRGSPAVSLSAHHGIPLPPQDGTFSSLEPTPNDRDVSTGGGYFPEVPTFTSEISPSTLPTAPSNDTAGVSAPPTVDIELPTAPTTLTDFNQISQSQETSSFTSEVKIPEPQVLRQAEPAHYNTDDVAISQAQKHARWAISAMNFEDVDTAVKELQAALVTLGAR